MSPRKSLVNICISSSIWVKSATSFLFISSMNLSNNMQCNAWCVSLTVRTDLLYIFPLTVRSTEPSAITSLCNSKYLYLPSPKCFSVIPSYISLWDMPSMMIQDLKISRLVHFISTASHILLHQRCKQWNAIKWIFNFSTSVQNLIDCWNIRRTWISAVKITTGCGDYYNAVF